MIRAHSGIHLRRAGELFDLAASWVDIDRTVAVGPANMPLGSARQAMSRVVRATRWAGIRVGQSGSIDAALDDGIFSFVPIGSVVASRRAELVESAHRGLLRGLGLSILVVTELPAASVRGSTPPPTRSSTNSRTHAFNSSIRRPTSRSRIS